jgi:hypothetical protein
MFTDYQQTLCLNSDPDSLDLLHVALITSMGMRNGMVSHLSCNVELFWPFSG